MRWPPVHVLSHRRLVLAVAFSALSLTLAPGCKGGGGDQRAPSVEVAAMNLSSPAFADGGAIPRDYTCDGRDVSPPLAWPGAPQATAAFAIIVDDPDAKSFVHWLAYNIPPGTPGLEEAASPGGPMPPAAREGRNSFGNSGYGGPCPPRGKPHHYVFRIYALDAPLELAGGASSDALERAMEGHIIAEGRLTGTYERE